MHEALSLTIEGRVQGVGFRYWTQNKAISLDLKGWVKNLPDGKVEIFAVGKKEKLEAFLFACYKGPILSKVINIRTSWHTQVENYPDFKIIH